MMSMCAPEHTARTSTHRETESRGHHTIGEPKNRLCHVQDEVEKLDREVAGRHVQELADLQRRQPTAGASSAHPADVMQLADSLYDTKLSAGAEKVISSCTLPCNRGHHDMLRTTSRHGLHNPLCAVSY